jgi:hypothetical protein
MRAASHSLVPFAAGLDPSEGKASCSHPALGRRARDSGVYAGSTSLSFEVDGRHRLVGDFLDAGGFARLGPTGNDARSTLVMKGSPVPVRASALSISRDFFVELRRLASPRDRNHNA